MILEKIVNNPVSRALMLTLSLSLPLAASDFKTTKNNARGIIHIKSAFFDYKVMQLISKGNIIPYSIDIKPLTKQYKKPELLGILIHGYDSNAKTSFQDSAFTKQLKMINNSLDDIIYIEYPCKNPKDHDKALSNQEISDLAYKVLNEFHRKSVIGNSDNGRKSDLRKIDFDNTITLMIGYSNGAIIEWDMLQRHPDIIEKYNLIGSVYIGPPFSGANDLIKTFDFTLFTHSKQMEDFTHQSELSKRILNNCAPLLPKLIVFGEISQKDAKGKYRLIHPLIPGKDDGLVSIDNNDPFLTFGWYEGNFGGLDFRIKTNLDHAQLVRHYKTPHIINHMSRFWYKAARAKFDSNRHEKKNTTLKNNGIELVLNNYEIEIITDKTYYDIDEYLTKYYNFKNALTELVIKNKVQSTGPFLIIDYDFINRPSFHPFLYLATQNNMYVLEFFGNEKITGATMPK